MEFKRQEDIEGQGEDGGEEGEEQLCRICFAKERTENLIKPCLCTAMVHRNCLDEWRAQEQFPHAFTHCPTCKYQYQTTILEDNAQQAYWARWRFRFFVARDMGGVFLGVQLFIMGFAKLIHLIDSGEMIPKLFPNAWVDDNSAPMAIGPYYCSAAILFFAFVGTFELLAFIGCWSPLTDLNRGRHRYGSETCPFCLDNCECCRMGGAMSDCSSCTECCSSASGGAGADAAAICGGIMLIMVLVLALLGVFVSVFFGTIVLQQAVQRHIHLIAMRAETRRTVVRDLADVPQEMLRQGHTLPSTQRMERARDMTA